MPWRRLQRLMPVCVAMCLLASVVAATPAAAQQVFMCGGKVATIVGTPSADRLEGTPGNDVIVGLQGNDHIYGGAGDDIICAGKGDDIVYGEWGFDIIFGAQGDDRLFAASTDGADVRGARMFGGAGNDELHGSDRWDRMQGGEGHDKLFGYAGQDWIRGGGGQDTIDGGEGQDDLHGGDGRDWLKIDAVDRNVRGGAGLDRCAYDELPPPKVVSCGDGERELPPPTVPLANAPTFDLAPIDGSSGWAGEIYGVVPTPVAQQNELPGRCFIIVGEFTPTGAPGTFSDRLNLGVLVDGQFFSASSWSYTPECVSFPANELGYTPTANDRLVGAKGAHYAQVFIPAAVKGPVTDVVIGDPTEDDASTTAAALQLPSMPTAPSFDPALDIPGAHPFDPDAVHSVDTIPEVAIESNPTVRVISFTAVAPVSFHETGDCFLLEVEMTPIVTEFGDTFLGALELVVDGQLDDPFGRCDDSEAEARGSVHYLRAEEAADGSAVKVHRTFAVPAGSSISHIVVNYGAFGMIVFESPIG